MTFVISFEENTWGTAVHIDNWPSNFVIDFKGTEKQKSEATF